MGGDEAIEGGLGVEMVRRFLDWDPACLRESGRYAPCVQRVGVEPCPDGGPAEPHPSQLIARASGSSDRLLDLPRVALELLAQPDRRCVLEEGAAGLDHRPALLALSVQRGFRTSQ